MTYGPVYHLKAIILQSSVDSFSVTMGLKVAVALVNLVVMVNAAGLPSYIKPCSVSSSDFKQCAMKHATEAVPHLLKGDKKFKIPPLNPLKLPLIEINPSSNFRLKLSDVTISGLETVVVKNVDFDVVNKKITVELGFDHIIINGQYDINGRLIIPLTGTGPGNITTYDAVVVYTADYDTTQKNGDEYLVIKKDSITFDRRKAEYRFDNLFGNKEISDGANRILNENADEVGGELRGVVTETIRSIVNSIISNIITTVPLKEILP